VLLVHRFRRYPSQKNLNSGTRASRDRKGGGEAERKKEEEKEKEKEKKRRGRNEQWANAHRN
jgi:hypothetical protein